MKAKFIIPVVAALLVVVGDLYTKQLIVDSMAYATAQYISPYFNIVHVRNMGAAFGLLSDADSALRVPFFITVSLIAFTVISVLVYKAAVDRISYVLGLGLVLGGAIGNFIDRIRYGYVIDFLDVHVGDYHWPAFNVADIAISVGVGFLIIDMLFEGKRAKDGTSEEGAQSA